MKALLLPVLLMLPSCGVLDSYQKFSEGGQKMDERISSFQELLGSLSGAVGEVGVIVAEADTDGSGGISGLGEGMDLLFGVGGVGGLVGLLNRHRKKETDELYDETKKIGEAVANLAGTFRPHVPPAPPAPPAG